MMDEYPEDGTANTELLEEIRDILAECLEIGREILSSVEGEDEEEED